MPELGRASLTDSNWKVCMGQAPRSSPWGAENWRGSSPLPWSMGYSGSGILHAPEPHPEGLAFCFRYVGHHHNGASDRKVWSQWTELCPPCPSPQEVAVGVCISFLSHDCDKATPNLKKGLDSCFEGLKATVIWKPWWQDCGTPSHGTLLVLPPGCREMFTGQLPAVYSREQVFLPGSTFSGDAIEYARGLPH